MRRHQGTFEKEIVVILDTNMLMTPAQISFDIFEEIKEVLIVPKITFQVMQTTITELTAIAQARTGEAREAKIALQLVKQMKIEVIAAPKGMEKLSYADSVIIAYATEENNTPEKTIIVATNDKMLKKRLLEKGISVMSVAGKQRIILQRPQI